MTPPDQNTKQRDDYNHIIGAIALLVIAIILFVGYSSLSQYFSCAVAPNGFLLAQANASKPYYVHPNVAVAYPDGRLLGYGTGRMDYWGRKGFAGWFKNHEDGGLKPFVYHNDKGLVFEHEEPMKYAQYYRLAKPKDRTEGILTDNTLYLYFKAFNGTYPVKADGKIAAILGETGTYWGNRRSWCPFRLVSQ